MRAEAAATPLELVTAVAVNEDPNTALAPVDGAMNVTVTPLTGLPPASTTVTCSGVANAVPIVVLCVVPAVGVMLDGAPVVVVRLKLAAVVKPATLDVTLYVPSWLLAVKAGAVATPLVFVVAVAVEEPANAPLAPVEGAVNVTVAPLTGLPLASVTMA